MKVSPNAGSNRKKQNNKELLRSFNIYCQTQKNYERAKLNKCSIQFQEESRS